MSEMETAESIMSRHKAIQARLWGNLYPPVPRERVFRPVEAPPRVILGRELYTHQIGPDLPPMTPQEAMRVIARENGLPVYALLGRSRKAEVVKARHEVIKWVDKNRKWSLPQIAAFMNCHHTTVLHALGGKREVRMVEKSEHDKQVEAGAKALRAHDMAARKPLAPWETVKNYQREVWLIKADLVLKAAASVKP